MPYTKIPETYSEAISKSLEKLRPKIIDEITKENLFYNSYKAMQNKPNKWGLTPAGCDKCEHGIHFSLCGTDGCQCISTEKPVAPAVALKLAVDQAEAQKSGKSKYSVYNKNGYEIQTIYLPYPAATSIKVVHNLNKSARTYFRFMDDGGRYFYAEEGTAISTVKKLSSNKNQTYLEHFSSEKKLASASLSELAAIKEYSKKLYELEKKVELQEEKKKLEQQMQDFKLQQAFKFVPSPDGVWNTTQPYPYQQYQQQKNDQYINPWFGAGGIGGGVQLQPWEPYVDNKTQPPFPGIPHPPTVVEDQKPKPEPEPEIVGEKKRRMIAITIERIDDEPVGNEGQPVGDPAKEEGAGGEGRGDKFGEAATPSVPQADRP